MDKRKKTESTWANQFRVSVPKPHTFMLFLSIVTAYIIKAYDKKPSSFAWVEHSVKMTLSYYISPDSVTDSLEFTISALILWLCIYLAYRMILRSLLNYKGWMFESRGKVSLFTRVWGALLTAFSNGLTGFYAFQNHCPALPVPILEDTIKKYLMSMKALLQSKDFNELKASAEVFLSTVGPNLQSQLHKKWWMSRNYVTDWWESYVYLSSRDSIMINSNYYGLAPKEVPTKNSISRAAGQIWSILKWRKDALFDNKVLPLKLQKLVPLCPNQYKRFFGTSRIPGEQKDEIIVHEGTTHIAVFANGNVYKMDVTNPDGSPISPVKLESTLTAICNDKSDVQGSKISYLAAGTAMNRTKWALARKELLKSNSQPLEVIESALFHVWFDLNQPITNVKNLCQRGLHGNGENIWFDKSYTYVFLPDGQFVLNIEHAWADGAVTCHVCEETNVIEHLLIEYHPDTGKIIGENVDSDDDFEVLIWSDLDKTLSMIEPHTKIISDRISTLDINSMEFKKFGKDTIKKWRCSPDAIVQMAMQLANFRTRGKFVQTYEAGLARIFKDGRTETIRSCSNQAVAFVKEMLNRESDNERRKKALQDAVRFHGLLTKQAMIGEGVDRHLFALCCVAMAGGSMPEFLEKYKHSTWADSKIKNWELSTSCAPNGFGEFFNSKKYPMLISMGAGFGWTNGFGVGYQLNDESITFHTSCNKTQNLSVDEFHDNLHESLVSISQLFD